jgi:hypothetical protein
VPDPPRRPRKATSSVARHHSRSMCQPRAQPKQTTAVGGVRADHSMSSSVGNVFDGFCRAVQRWRVLKWRAGEVRRGGRGGDAGKTGGHMSLVLLERSGRKRCQKRRGSEEGNSTRHPTVIASCPKVPSNGHAFGSDCGDDIISQDQSSLWLQQEEKAGTHHTLLHYLMHFGILPSLLLSPLASS